MAQEARHPFRLFGPGKKRLNKNGLSEPFLSPGGSVHTTEAIEKSKLPARWLVLMLLSLLMIGNYYCYDNPAALYSLLAAEFSSTEHFDFCDRLPSNRAHCMLRAPLLSASADAAPASRSAVRLRRPVLGVLVPQHRAAARRRHDRRPVGRRQVALPLHTAHPARAGHLRSSMQARPLHASSPPAPLPSPRCPAARSNAPLPQRRRALTVAAPAGSMACCWGAPSSASAARASPSNPNPIPNPNPSPSSNPDPDPTPSPDPDPKQARASPSRRAPSSRSGSRPRSSPSPSASRSASRALAPCSTTRSARGSRRTSAPSPPRCGSGSPSAAPRSCARSRSALSTRTTRALSAAGSRWRRRARARVLSRVPTLRASVGPSGCSPAAASWCTAASSPSTTLPPRCCRQP